MSRSDGGQAGTPARRNNRSEITPHLANAVGLAGDSIARQKIVGEHLFLPAR